MPYADSFRMETDRMNRIGFFHSVNPARHTIHIYISFPSLINRKQIPPLVYTRRKRGMQDAHKSWLLFSFFWERFFATGYWLRLKHRRKKKNKKKTRNNRFMRRHYTTHNNNNRFPLATPPIPNQPFFPSSLLHFVFFLFSFQYFLFSSLCLGPLLFLSLVSYIKNNTLELRPGCQTRNPTNRYALH